jgi:acylphosphatase
MVRARVLISGMVQGVFFRVFVREEAGELDLSGWVRNTGDGKVEAVFEGEKEKVEEIIELCRKGPVGSEVEDVEVEWSEPEGIGGFEIR